MKKSFICISLFACVYTTSAQTFRSSDSIQIISIINDWNRAWEIKDYQLAAKWYSADARFTNAFGDTRNGQKEIELLLKHVFSLRFVMAGESKPTQLKFQILDNDNLVVHSEILTKGQEMPDGSVLPERHTTHLRVFQRYTNGWLIKAHLISDAKEKQLFNK